MFRLAFLIACFVATVMAPPCPGLCGADQPNILWLTAEDMSPTLGCFGDSYATTPHIDALALQSVKFTQAFATAPVCSPSRSCLITGCYATSLGTQRLRSSFPIPERVSGFPSLLRQAGYYCTNSVKTDYNTSSAKAIIQSSWDESSAEAHWRGRKPNQPFFCVFNHMVSHQSRTMVWPYEQFQQQVQKQLRPDEIHDPETAPVPPYYPDTPLVRQTVARYYDCVTAMDKSIGRLLQQLEEDGLAEDTIVFFYSDHGSGMPRHKRALLDSGMHVPLLVRFPKKYQHLAPGPPGSTSERLVSFVDFGPTVLRLCGVPVPDPMQGLAFLGPGAEPPRDYVYGARDRVDEVYDVARSVRNREFLYIRNFWPHLSYHQPSGWPDGSAMRREMTQYAKEHAGRMRGALEHYLGPTRPLEELYDVTKDPMNLRNLANDPKHHSALEKMRQEMCRWILDSGDCGFLSEADARKRSVGTTMFDIRYNKTLNPIATLLDTASLVGTGNTKAGRRQLDGALRDSDSSVRFWAAVGFVAMGTGAADARAELDAALQDPSPTVRIEVANALLRLGPSEPALATLIAALEEGTPSETLHAARTVELLGERAAGARAAMRAARQDARRGGDLHFFVDLAAAGFEEALPQPTPSRDTTPR